MTIVCGVGQLVYPFFCMFNCAGFVTEFCNFAPATAVGLYKAAKARDFDRVIELTNQIAPYYEFRARLLSKRSPVPSVLSPFLSPNDLPLVQSIIKEAMTLTGLPGGTAREPIENLTAEEIEELRDVLKELGAL
jgi:dihydrodipicolinate synthase/N-acetylneuraminate lyase